MTGSMPRPAISAGPARGTDRAEDVPAVPDEPGAQTLAQVAAADDHSAHVDARSRAF